LYQKFTANHIFSGHEMLPAGHVLITDEAGKIVDIVDIADGGEGVRVLQGMLMPGFINCHCHLELSHLHGRIPENTGLVDFVIKIVNERDFDEAKILAAIEKAEDQLLQNGVVAVGDICNNTFTLSQKRKKRLHYHNFIEVSGFPPAVAQIRFERAVLFYDLFRSAAASSVVPHAPYSVSPQLFGMINDLQGNDLLTIHNQETPAEDDLFKHKTGDFLRMYKEMGIDISFFEPSGYNSLQSFLPYFNKALALLLVHNVTTSSGDLEFIKRSGANNHLSTFLCLCPNANLYISSTLPDVNLFVKNNCNIVLGTDSLASNHQLDIWAEIKSLHKNFPELPLTTMLQWATFNGARALQMQNELGSFEKGKQPGLVLVSGLDGLEITESSFARRIL
jgi:cytosine/adenosine deaminase-related metal-dependent hydrolase